jgi:hypothetical protein
MIKWEIQRVEWGLHQPFLNQGWEPFAVISELYSNPSMASIGIIYQTREIVFLRRSTEVLNMIKEK